MKRVLWCLLGALPRDSACVRLQSVEGLDSQQVSQQAEQQPSRTDPSHKHKTQQLESNTGSWLLANSLRNWQLQKLPRLLLLAVESGW